MHLTLVVPELLWPEPDDRETLNGLACPALETLLTRSRRAAPCAPQSLEATLSDLFGHPEGAPYASFRLLGEAGSTNDVGAHAWLIADPVHLRFHQERLILADGASLAIGLDEAQAIADGLNAHFADIGRFHVAAADRWYVQLAPTTVLHRYEAPPLSTVAGRSVEQLLPELMHEREMRKLMNEIQTVLHAHPVNRQRESDGRLPINSLWLWGSGRLPERHEAAYDGAWSTLPLVRGLARAAGVPAHPAPVDAARFFDHAAPDTDQLVILDDLVAPVQYENGEGYRAAIASLEQRWFAPLRKALLGGRIGELRIEATSVYATLSWKTRRSEQWQFWRQTRPLAALAKELAEAATE